MTHRRRISRTTCAIVSVLASLSACSSSEAGRSGEKGAAPGSSGGTPAGTGGTGTVTTGGMSQTGGAQTGGLLGTGGVAQTGGALGTGGAAQSGASSSGGVAQSGGALGSGGATESGGALSTGGAPQSGGTQGGGTGGSTGGKGGGAQVGGSGGKAGSSAGGATQTGGSGGAVSSSCVGKAWTTAEPSTTGPFQVAADKGVGPLAGALPDPVYGDKQQRFNVYRPKDLGQSGYCHPILVWANGHTDNPEPNPPDCVSSKYCGSYLMLVNQMASHGFVVIASLSTITSQGNPLPTIVGLDWLLQQAEDPSSPYYHHLDTAHIGAFGHSEGGLSTSKAASDPRISAIATVSGSAANAGIHQPVLLFCGAKDTVVSCESVTKTFNSITTQPAMLINNLSADHGGWLYQNGAKGPDIFGMTAWFRYYLMGDMQQKDYFVGASCKFCSDSRVTVMRNNLLQ